MLETLAGGGGNDAGGHDTGHGGGSVPPWNVVALCTVAGVVFFHFISGQLDVAVSQKRHAREMLESVYKELSVLGLVAFVLFSIETYSDIGLEAEDAHLFEVIHMTLFMAAIFHSAFVGVIVVLSRQISRRWDVYEDDELRRYKAMKQQYRRTAAALGLRHRDLKGEIGTMRRLWLSLRHPGLYSRLVELSQHVSYHDLRSRFIRRHHLPRNFRFAGYLKTCQQHVALELSQIREGAWAAFALAMGVDLYVKGLFADANAEDLHVLFIISAGLVVVCALAVYWKVKRVHSTLLRMYTSVGPVSTRSGRRLLTGSAPASDGEEEKDEERPALMEERRQQQMSLFWFGAPGFLLLALQLLQFLLAVMVALLIQFGGVEESVGNVIGGSALTVLAVGVFLFTLPRFIPAFTMVTHVGEMVDRRRLAEALSKQQRAFRSRVVPPTLRQVTQLAAMKDSTDGGFRGAVRHFLSNPKLRHALMVLVAVHFFLVAANTESVAKGEEPGRAFTAQCILAAFGLLETLVHIWSLCGLRGTVAVGSRLRGYHDNADLLGGGEGALVKAGVGGVMWADLLLTLAVAGLVVGTALSAGLLREILHALQALVLGRLFPLSYPISLSSYEDGQLPSVSRRERQQWIEETLSLLHRQQESSPHLPPAALSFDPHYLTSPPLVEEHHSLNTYGNNHEAHQGLRRGFKGERAKGGGGSGDSAVVVHGKRGLVDGASMLPSSSTNRGASTGAADKAWLGAPDQGVLVAPGDNGALGQDGALGPGIRKALGQAGGDKEEGEGGYKGSEESLEGQGQEVDGQGETTVMAGGSTKEGTELVEGGNNGGLKAVAWQCLEDACREHPEVSARHGRISLPMMRIMLGLPPYQDNGESTTIMADDEEGGIAGTHTSLPRNSWGSGKDGRGLEEGDGQGLGEGEDTKTGGDNDMPQPPSSTSSSTSSSSSSSSPPPSPTRVRDSRHAIRPRGRSVTLGLQSGLPEISSVSTHRHRQPQWQGQGPGVQPTTPTIGHASWHPGAGHSGVRGKFKAWGLNAHSRRLSTQGPSQGQGQLYELEEHLGKIGSQGQGSETGELGGVGVEGRVRTGGRILNSPLRGRPHGRGQGFESGGEYAQAYYASTSTSAEGGAGMGEREPMRSRAETGARSSPQDSLPSRPSKGISSKVPKRGFSLSQHGGGGGGTARRVRPPVMSTSREDVEAPVLPPSAGPTVGPGSSRWGGGVGMAPPSRARRSSTWSPPMKSHLEGLTPPVVVGSSRDGKAVSRGTGGGAGEGGAGMGGGAGVGDEAIEDRGRVEGALADHVVGESREEMVPVSAAPAVAGVLNPGDSAPSGTEKPE